MPVITGVLQQSAPLRPFVRQFVELLLVAGGTSGNDIGNVIASPSRKGNYMLSMPFRRLLAAIVATVTLALNLFLELVSSKRRVAIQFGNTSLVVYRFPDRFSAFAMSVCLAGLFTLFRAIVLSAICPTLFWMFLIPSQRRRPPIFSVALVVLVVVFQPLVFVLLLPLNIILVPVFFVLLVPRLIESARTGFAFAFELVSAALIEERQGQNLSTQAAGFAWGKIGRYTGIHDKAPILVVTPSEVTASRGQLMYTSSYHNSASKATSRLFSRPISSFLEA